MAPILLTEENSDRALAFDSVSLLRDPFPMQTYNLFSVDGRSRVMLLGRNLDLLAGEQLSAITVQAVDAQHRTYPVTVEYLGRVPQFDWLSQLIIKLPDEIPPGDVTVYVTLRGLTSNRVIVTTR